MDKKIDIKKKRYSDCQIVRQFCKKTDGQIDRETKKTSGRQIN